MSTDTGFAIAVLLVLAAIGAYFGGLPGALLAPGTLLAFLYAPRKPKHFPKSTRRND